MKKKKSIIGAHLGTDSGPLVPKHDTQTIRPRSQIMWAQYNGTLWTENPGIGPFHMHKQNMFLK